jgi:hypothetical protein
MDFAQQAGLRRHQLADTRSVSQPHRAAESYLGAVFQQWLGNGRKSLDGEGGAVERRKASQVLVARLRAPAQQPRYHLPVSGFGGDVQLRAALTVACVDQRFVCFPQPDSPGAVALQMAALMWSWRRRCCSSSMMATISA